MRILESPMGQSIEVTITNAMILAREYHDVCVIHNGTPVIVSRGDTPYEIQATWNQTRAIKDARKWCGGK